MSHTLVVLTPWIIGGIGIANLIMSAIIMFRQRRPSNVVHILREPIETDGYLGTVLPGLQKRAGLNFGPQRRG